jgi:hypothetical protein
MKFVFEFASNIKIGESRVIINKNIASPPELFFLLGLQKYYHHFRVMIVTSVSL